MEVTVLGASPSCPNAGGACAGYLIRAGADTVLIDCGPGVIASLQKHLSYHALPTIVISHLHADHCLDLIPLFFGLRFSPDRDPNFRPRLYLPPQGTAQLAEIIRPLGLSQAAFNDMFAVREYDPKKDLMLGALTLCFVEVEHYVQTHGVRISAGGTVVAYSADTGPCQALVGLARNADLFICEATLNSREEAMDDWGHLTAWEAGMAAQQAGVKRLVLTHVWQEVDPGRMLEEARTVYDGPVELAAEGKVYRIKSLSREE